MKQICKRNKIFDDKLYDEILVDSKDIYEQNMSWYYYAQDYLEFPFKAKIELKKRNGKREVKEIEVLDLSEDLSNFEESFDLKVEIELNEYIIEVPLINLKDIQGSEQTIDVAEIWKYWKKR